MRAFKGMGNQANRRVGSFRDRIVYIRKDSSNANFICQG